MKMLMVIVLLCCVPRIHGQQLVEAEPSRPAPVGSLPQEGSAREDALLCYHDGAAYFVKLPHPVYGLQDRIYQRVTTGAPGHMNGFELRLHNDYPGHTRHAGTLQVSVHRRVSGLPGPHEQLLELDADTLGNEIFTVPLPQPFHFIEGEEFYLGLRFQPAAAMDTIAYVTAPLGTYTGHSFYIQDGQVTWWGDGQSTLFGDFHFCADVWLDSAQPFLSFPWTSLDLGKGKAGTELDLVLPLVNQGTAPLVIQSVTVDEPRWTCHVEGPDSLAPADTLLLHLAWQADSAEAQSEAELTLRSNAANGPVRRLPLRAAASTADVLMADWDEWELATLQEGESGQDPGWRGWTGLGRPGPFMGHDAGPGSLNLEDLLVLRRLRVAQGSGLRLRWVQFQRLRLDMVRHGLLWRCGENAAWEEVPGVDLQAQEMLGPENEWYPTPWLEFQAPCSGDLELGLLYGGLGAGDQWYVDDLELVVEGEPGAPDLAISSRCGAMVLTWRAVPGADAYAVRLVGPGPPRLLAWTTATSWIHGRAQRLQQGWYQVGAWMEDGRGLPALPDPAETESSQEGEGP